jgi:peptidoglycan/xylan/chitin deacetylase (PgdA/CDA1 family)
MIRYLCRSRAARALAAAASPVLALTLAAVLAGALAVSPAEASGAGTAGVGGTGGNATGAGAADVGAAHRGSCRNGYVGLTYDDGPTAATRPALLAALRAAHARATFFDMGSNARLNPELVRASLRAGMWIGNHTYSHPHLPQIGEPAAYQEIASTQFVLQQVTGRLPTLFRPPFGETNDQVRADEASAGLLEVLWTVDSRDWAGASTAEIVAAAATLQPGGIILMHDWAQASLDAVPQIAAGLASRGLCTGRIAFTPRDIPYGGNQVFHAVAVAP